MSRDEIPKPQLRDIETLEPSRPSATRKDRPRPWLTILHHPDPERVGDWCNLFADGRTLVALSRLEPVFQKRPGADQAPLETPFLSRTPHHLSPSGRGGIRLVVEPEASPVMLAGERLHLTRSFEPAALAEGVVLVLSERVVLLLHQRNNPPQNATQSMGMVGRSPKLEALRQAIGQLALGDSPVLIRGQSGVGKELAARALHASGSRACGPLLSINMAAIPASTAAAELFGHTPGAFTGATHNRRGYFEQAHGGCLLMDEIGAASPEIQGMILRTLETGEIQPIGDSQPRRVDTRVLAATDEDLERAMEVGRFRSPLYYRLAAHQLWVPSLSDRREDLGRLLSHFLREDLRQIAQEDRLADGDWLGAGLVARLMEHAWPGNVRQLRNVVRHLVTHFGDAARVDEASVLASLREPESKREASKPDRGRKAPADLGEQELLRALREHQFQVKPTAQDLGISRTSLYALMEACPSLRKASEIPDREILDIRRTHGGDVSAMAAQLMVSVQALRARLKQLDP